MLGGHPVVFICNIVSHRQIPVYSRHIVKGSFS